jgi:hypothetical protein
MDEQLLQKLTNLGATQQRNGRQALRASVHLPERIEASRAERRDLLTTHFAKLGNLLHDIGGEVDLDSLSVSGQSVEAIVPIDVYDDVERAVRDAGCTMRPDFDRKLT